MNGWARIVLAIAVLATLGWIVAGALGYRTEDSESLAVHTLVAFTAVLGLVFAHGWVALFALVARRLLRAPLLEGGHVEQAEPVRATRWAAGAAIAALLSTLAYFTLSNLRFANQLDARSHAALALVSTLILVVAWGVEAWALTRHGRYAASAQRTAPRQCEPC